MHSVIEQCLLFLSSNENIFSNIESSPTYYQILLRKCFVALRVSGSMNMNSSLILKRINYFNFSTTKTESEFSLGKQEVPLKSYALPMKDYYQNVEDFKD